MVFINEWLPNPIGADAKGEFIELCNNGTVPVDLGGMGIVQRMEKEIQAVGVTPANEYLFCRGADEAIAQKYGWHIIFVRCGRAVGRPFRFRGKRAGRGKFQSDQL